MLEDFFDALNNKLDFLWLILFLFIVFCITTVKGGIVYGLISVGLLLLFIIIGWIKKNKNRI